MVSKLLKKPTPLQAVDGVMSVALCLQVLSQAPQRFRSSDWGKPLLTFAFPVSLSARSFAFTPMSRGVFEGGCRILTHANLGFPFHILKKAESVRMMACLV